MKVARKLIIYIIIKALINKTDLSPERIISSSRKNANKLCQEIKDGISRLLNKNSTKKITSILFDVKNVKGIDALYFHGHQFRQLIKNKEYCLFTSIPKLITFGHYHRLFAFKKGNVIFVCAGCLTQSMPNDIYEEILMQGIGTSVQRIANNVIKQIIVVRA